MSIREISDCIFSSLVIPLLAAAVWEYQFFPLYAEMFADIVRSYGRVSAHILSIAEDGELVIRFRIERERKTVIQKCRVYSASGKKPSKYLPNQRITVYFRDCGTTAEAIPENDNKYSYLYELHRRICAALFAAAGLCALLAVIL